MVFVLGWVVPSCKEDLLKSYLLGAQTMTLFGNRLIGDEVTLTGGHTQVTRLASSWKEHCCVKRQGHRDRRQSWKTRSRERCSAGRSQRTAGVTNSGQGKEEQSSRGFGVGMALPLPRYQMSSLQNCFKLIVLSPPFVVPVPAALGNQ